MEDLIEYIATSLVDDPSEVRVRQTRRGSQAVIKLRVAKEDMGRVIGRGGRVANAMRTLLRVAASQDRQQRVSLDIVEPR